MNDDIETLVRRIRLLGPETLLNDRSSEYDWEDGCGKGFGAQEALSSIAHNHPDSNIRIIAAALHCLWTGNKQIPSA